MFVVFSSQNVGGILDYIQDDIPSKLIAIDRSVECLFIKLKFKKTKWPLCSSYNHNKSLISNHRTITSKSSNVFLTFLIGNLHAARNNTNEDNFCQRYNIRGLLMQI